MNILGLDNNIVATSRKASESEKWYVYNKDIRQSTSSIVSDAGDVVKAYVYDEFGNTQVRIGEAFDNEICYTGQIYDEVTGLYYYNARYYNPEEGRFISQDTYRGETNDPMTYHLYAYCANNPINYVDPTGHASVPTYYSETRSYNVRGWGKITTKFDWWKSKKLKKVLLVATGALMSPVMNNQKLTIPSISHAVCLEAI
jgi:RHS repeat-associated protein